MAIGMPTGASSNIPIGACWFCTSSSLTTRLVEVLISVTELVRIEANASGRQRVPHRPRHEHCAVDSRECATARDACDGVAQTIGWRPVMQRLLFNVCDDPDVAIRRLGTCRLRALDRRRRIILSHALS